MWIKSLLKMTCLTLAFFATAAYAKSFEPATLQQAYEQLHEAVCVLTFTQEATDPRSGEQERQDGTAVALVVSPEGLLMSNGHLQLENIRSFNFRVRINRGDEQLEFPAVMLDKPEDVNLSFLRIQSDEPLNLPFVRFARGSALRLGEPVALVGIMGEAMGFHRSVRVDRITAILDTPRTTYCLTEGLRLGFVTSPVLNTRGEVVGVAGFELDPDEGGGMFARAGHPLVFQTEMFIHHVDRPPDESPVASPAEEAWLGVFTQPLKKEYAEYWGIAEPGGLIVSTVMPDSPAARAGLVPGDIIRSVDGAPVRALLDREVYAFTKMIRESKPQTIIELGILREGAEILLQATLGQRPRSARDAEEVTDETLGLVVREITRDVRILLNLGEEVEGVIVRRIISGSPAHVAGMRPGIIIMGLGDQPVIGLDDFETAVARLQESRPTEVSVFARIGAQTGFFRLMPRW